MEQFLKINDKIVKRLKKHTLEIFKNILFRLEWNFCPKFINTHRVKLLNRACKLLKASMFACYNSCCSLKTYLNESHSTKGSTAYWSIKSIVSVKHHPSWNMVWIFKLAYLINQIFTNQSTVPFCNFSL